MPTSNDQINDPEGQSVMDVFLEAGIEPSGAYNATQGIENMAGDRVIAEIGVMKAELTARMDSYEATTSASIDALEATTSARFDALEATTSARFDALESTTEALAAATAARFDAVDAQIAMLTWAIIATFTIITAIAATGFFRKSGWWSRGDDRRRLARPRGSGGRRRTQRNKSSGRRDHPATRGRQLHGRSRALRASRCRSG